MNKYFGVLVEQHFSIFNPSFDSTLLKVSLFAGSFLDVVLALKYASCGTMDHQCIKVQDRGNGRRSRVLL